MVADLYQLLLFMKFLWQNLQQHFRYKVRVQTKTLVNNQEHGSKSLNKPREFRISAYPNIEIVYKSEVHLLELGHEVTCKRQTVLRSGLALWTTGLSLPVGIKGP